MSTSPEGVEPPADPAQPQVGAGEADDPARPSAAIPPPSQPQPSQPPPFQPQSFQPQPSQPEAFQPPSFAAQPFPAQEFQPPSFGAQPFPAQQYTGQPYPGPYPGQLYPPPYQGYPGYPPMMQRPGTNGFAIAALVCGIVFNILGIVFGVVALGQIKRTGEDGRGLALAGIWIGAASLALTVVWIIVIFFTFNHFLQYPPPVQ